MKNKRKEHFINDKRRRSYLASVYTRMYRGKSALIEGAYGAGKTRFLQLIQPKKLKPVWLESLDNRHEILASILQELNYDGGATHWHTSRNLKKICSLSGFFIVIDEANDLDRRVWPYFKRIIDAHIPMVFAGLPKVRTYLLCGAPHNRYNVEFIVMRSPQFANPATQSFRCILTPHKRAAPQ